LKFDLLFQNSCKINKPLQSSYKPTKLASLALRPEDIFNCLHGTDTLKSLYLLQRKGTEQRRWFSSCSCTCSECFSSTTAAFCWTWNKL